MYKVMKNALPLSAKHSPFSSALAASALCKKYKIALERERPLFSLAQIEALGWFFLIVYTSFLCIFHFLFFSDMIDLWSLFITFHEKVVPCDLTETETRGLHGDPFSLCHLSQRKTQLMHGLLHERARRGGWVLVTTDVSPSQVCHLTL